MQVGDGIKSSFAPGYGTLGLFLKGTFFGIDGIALLTNAHVTGEKTTSPGVWAALYKVWTSLYPNVKSPAVQRKALYHKLGTMFPDFRNGTLPDNPPRSLFLATATNPNNRVFEGENRNCKLSDLFGSISEEEGTATIADTIYQPKQGNDFAVAVLRPGVQYDNRARKGGSGSEKHEITKIGSAVQDATVYKFGHTSKFRQSTVSKSPIGLFYVKGTEHKNPFYNDYNGFSAKGDSGSAIFDEQNAWLGLLYAGGVTQESNAKETKCFAAATIMASLKNSHSDNIELAGSTGTA